MTGEKIFIAAPLFLTVPAKRRFELGETSTSFRQKNPDSDNYLCRLNTIHEKYPFYRYTSEAGS